MKTTVERLDRSRVSLQIEVEPERVDEALERAYRKVVRRVNIPGFRKGKVPRRILELRMGREVLYDDAMEELVAAAYAEAVKDAALKPVASPDVDVLEFEPGKTMRLKAEVDVLPEVKLGTYAGLKGTRRLRPVTEERVEAVLQELREMQAELVEAPSEEVRPGDYVLVDYEGALEGRPFSGGAARGVTLVAGSDASGPGFQDQLVGMKRGETRDLTVQFPEEGVRQELAGKSVTFRVTVHEIKEKRLPELDDEFARDVSDKESLEELRADVRARLEKDAADEADHALKDDLVRQVVDVSEVEIPTSMEDHELDHVIQELSEELGRQGVTLEQYLEHQGQSVDQLRESFRPDAARRVKTRLVLEELAEAAGIEVREEEVAQRIDEIVNRSSSPSDAFRRYLEEPQQKESLQASLRLRKTLDHLASLAEVETVEVKDGPAGAGGSEAEAGPGASGGPAEAAAD
ncbi:trigger factor [Limnochorda pilosa]|uniref:Trigger factor n=1 Tax=Limnochorda pilosa TaxID=1555112 RepID=A0A0K2SJA7_LIMPI|nr:trigger factor [Limnochorda pilosa]BAS27178.1 trigger factor [Limnochorda pilosa]